jgi:hypothetical protein
LKKNGPDNLLFYAFKLITIFRFSGLPERFYHVNPDLYRLFQAAVVHLRKQAHDGFDIVESKGHDDCRFPAGNIEY